MQSKTIVGDINNYAMQNGITLGILGIASLVVFKWSLTLPFLSTLFCLLLLSIPILATFLTFRVRNYIASETGTFSFMSGFLHALFTGFYASIWVALFTFVYLQYFDHGSIFVAYGKAIDTPEMQLYLQETGINTELNSISGAQGVQGLVEAMEKIGPATYAAMILYSTLFFAPIFSTIIAIICRKK